jgi:recombination protein RecT
MTQSTAIVQDTYRHVSNALTSRIQDFQTLLAPYGMSGARFAQIVIDALGRTPALLQCESKSIVRAAYYAAEIGLELGGPLGDAYLVPYWNGKQKRKEAQCIPGYRGLMHIAHAADPRIVNFDSQVVYESDGFSETRGAHPDLVHIPAKRDRGPAVAVYAVAFLKVDTILVPQFTVMSIEEVDAIEKESLSKMKEQWMRDQSPWAMHKAEMQRKTAVRRLVKMMNLRGSRMAIALEHDARDYGEKRGTTRTDDLKTKLGQVPTEVIDGECDEVAP